MQPAKMPERASISAASVDGKTLKSGAMLAACRAYAMSPEESKRYIDMVTPVVASILSANPKVKDDYEALLAAAKKYRQ